MPIPLPLRSKRLLPSDFGDWCMEWRVFIKVINLCSVPRVFAKIPKHEFAFLDVKRFLYGACILRAFCVRSLLPV